VLLFFGLLLPRLLRPLHLPFATSLILVGALLGPYGLDLVSPDDSLRLFGLLGGMLYMLLAGTQARTLGFTLSDRATRSMALPNALIPAAIGVGLGRWFGYGWSAAFFIGTVFLASSIMLVFGIVEAYDLEDSDVGKLIMKVAVVEDLSASLLAFVIFQALAPQTRFPLPILGGLLLSSVVLLRMFLPEVVGFFFTRFEARGGDDHEARLRLVIALFLLVIFAYSVIDVHPVIAAFLVGFALAEIPEAPVLRERIETMGYGFFIPVFLFVVGLDTDFSVITRMDVDDGLAVALLVGAVGGKLGSGWLGARWAGLRGQAAWVAGAASTAKLAVPLTATYAARDLGVVDGRLYSAIIVVSVVSSIVAPALTSLMKASRLSVHA
jgi:Kef-type K+ transport system membrane component KefB